MNIQSVNTIKYGLVSVGDRAHFNCNGWGCSEPVTKIEVGYGGVISIRAASGLIMELREGQYKEVTYNENTV